MYGVPRDATGADVPGILRVYLRAYAQPPWNEQNDPMHTERYVRWLMAQPHMQTLVVPTGEPDGEPEGESGGGPHAGTVAGFVMASAPRPYADFVADWEYMADRPPDGWPIVPGRLGYVWELAVEPSRQRSGVGSALLAATLDRLRVAGAERVLLRSSERAAAAMALYRKFGFTRLPVRERRDPLAGPWMVEVAQPPP